MALSKQQIIEDGIKIATAVAQLQNKGEGITHKKVAQLIGMPYSRVYHHPEMKKHTTPNVKRRAASEIRWLEEDKYIREAIELIQSEKRAVTCSEVIAITGLKRHVVYLNPLMEQFKSEPFGGLKPKKKIEKQSVVPPKQSVKQYIKFIAENYFIKPTEVVHVSEDMRIDLPSFDSALFNLAINRMIRDKILVASSYPNKYYIGSPLPLSGAKVEFESKPDPINEMNKFDKVEAATNCSSAFTQSNEVSDDKHNKETIKCADHAEEESNLPKKPTEYYELALPLFGNCEFLVIKFPRNLSHNDRETISDAFEFVTKMLRRQAA